MCTRQVETHKNRLVVADACLQCGTIFKVDADDVKTETGR